MSPTTPKCWMRQKACNWLPCRLLSHRYFEPALSAKAPFDAAGIARDTGDVLADTLGEDGLPRHELEGDAVVNHSEAATGEAGPPDEPPADVLARIARSECQSTFGRHLTAETGDLGLFKARIACVRS